MLNALPEPGGLEGVARRDGRAELTTEEGLGGVASGFSASLERLIDDLRSCFC